MPRTKTLLRWLFGLLFMLAGANHFRRPDFYVRIMPPYLPWHRALVDLSGILEMVLGVLLLIPRCTVPAARGLVALLVAVFPANLHMALHADQYPEFSALALWARLPLQGMLIAWAYWFTRPAAQDWSSEDPGEQLQKR